jgi:hypothetical protein
MYVCIYVYIGTAYICMYRCMYACKYRRMDICMFRHRGAESGEVEEHLDE